MVSLIPGDKFCQRATKQPIFHRGPWGAQTGPGIFGRQLIIIIINYNQPWTNLGLAPQPQRGNRDPNRDPPIFSALWSQGALGAPVGGLLRLQYEILASPSKACDFVGGPKHRGCVSGSKTSTKLSRRAHAMMHLFEPLGKANTARRDEKVDPGSA